jgi:hypothetical protein
MDWLKKLGEYAPDIVGAIMSGGATLPATALKIASKELMGYETEDKALIEKAVNDATPEQLIAMKQADINFKVEKHRLDNEDAANQRADTQNARKVHRHHWMPSALCSVLTLGMIAFTGLLFFREVPVSNNQMLNILFGSYLTAWLSSVNYWVSSTRGSAEKTHK